MVNTYRERVVRRDLFTSAQEVGASDRAWPVALFAFGMKLHVRSMMEQACDKVRTHIASTDMYHGIHMKLQERADGCVCGFSVMLKHKLTSCQIRRPLSQATARGTPFCFKYVSHALCFDVFHLLDQGSQMPSSGPSLHIGRRCIVSGTKTGVTGASSW